jgi:membrane protein required for colicin V production
MNVIDIVLGILLLIAFYRGIKKGLFVAITSLIGLIAGVYGAIYFSDYAAAYISNWFDWGAQTTQLVAFAVTFIIIVSLVSLAGRFLTKIADFAALGLINKILGGVFNLLTWAFIYSVFFMFINSWPGISFGISEERKETSVLYEPVASLAPMVIPHILKEVDAYKNSEEAEEASEEIE